MHHERMRQLRHKQAGTGQSEGGDPRPQRRPEKVPHLSHRLSGVRLSLLIFADPAARVQSFDPAAGTALAGALLVGLAGLYLARVRVPLRPLLPALAALLALWVLTGAVASAARQPESARYLYPGVILLALIAGAALARAPWRRARKSVCQGPRVGGAQWIVTLTAWVGSPGIPPTVAKTRNR